jgi:hypothetical protein
MGHFWVEMTPYKGHFWEEIKSFDARVLQQCQLGSEPAR